MADKYLQQHIEQEGQYIEEFCTCRDDGTGKRVFICMTNLCGGTCEKFGQFCGGHCPECLAERLVRAHREETLGDLPALVEWMDNDLDNNVAEAYKDQPLGQHWARVAKVVEEAGETIDALIGITGQNPRKGKYGNAQDLFDELSDVCLTGLYAIQHFTKDIDLTIALLMNRAKYHRSRRDEQINAVD